MPNREKYSTHTSWEKKAAYSRAIKVGPHIYVSGTTAVGPDGLIVGKGDVAAQFHCCLDRIEKALEHYGATLAAVVRTRVYLTDIAMFEPWAAAHGERFRGIDPVNTMVQIAALVHPDMLIEVEVDAYVHEEHPPVKEAEYRF